MGSYRHFRRNPTVSDAAGRSKLTFSVSDARKFLIKASCMGRREQQDHIDEIEEAQKVVARADKRNRRRKNRRKGNTSTDCSDIESSVDATCGPTTRPRDLNLDCLNMLQRRKEACNGTSRSRLTRTSDEEEHATVAHYEECLGPEGEVIRFKLHYNKSAVFLKRTRTRNEPQVGDIVLDLITGIKAWRITTNRRRKHPVTPAMRESYESSYIYKVRKLAAGRYASSNAANLTKFMEDIKNGEGQRLKKKSKKLKKRKNKKK